MVYSPNNHDFYYLRDPLIEGFDAQDREIDSQMGQWLSEQRVPVGLSQRVFKASVSLLPQPATAAEPVLRYVPAQRQQMQIRRRVISRLAMAASLALVCAVGLNVCIPSSQVTDAVTAADWGVFGSGDGDTDYGSVAHLLKTSELSFGDMTSELTMLVRNSGPEM